MVHLGKKPATKKKTNPRLTRGDALTIASRLDRSTEFSLPEMGECSCDTPCLCPGAEL
jgi:hypothetical protein